MPACEVLQRLKGEGKTNREIADMYGAKPEGVRVAFIRCGMKPPRAGSRYDHTRFFPWKSMRSDHKSDFLAKRLRALSKKVQGGQLGAGEDRLTDEFTSYMDGTNRWGLPLSVHYDRDEGFYLAPREPGDRDYIHPPKEGSPKT